MVVIEKSPSTTLTAPPRAPRKRIRQDTELSEVVAAVLP